LEAVRLELAQSQNRRNALQQQLGEALQQQPIGEGQDEREIVAVFPIDTRIEALEQKLDQLLIQYTDKHPDVNILRQTIADLKKQRDREKAQYSAALALSKTTSISNRNPKTYSFIDEIKVKLAEEQANVASLQVRVGEYEKRTRELREQVNVLPQVEAELAALNRDYDTNRKKYDELLARREALRLSEQAEQSKQDVRYRVVDPPRVPAAPNGPKRLLLTSLVLAGGLGAGIGLALLMIQLWPTFDSRRRLSQQMNGVPVFGSVGLVLSQTALRHERRMTFFFSLIGGVLLLIYAGLVVLETVGFR
jgi:polysaccharide chain length determinant protein (PEP-CTERM system associated)